MHWNKWVLIWRNMIHPSRVWHVSNSSICTLSIYIYVTYRHIHIMCLHVICMMSYAYTYTSYAYMWYAWCHTHDVICIHLIRIHIMSVHIKCIHMVHRCTLEQKIWTWGQIQVLMLSKWPWKRTTLTKFSSASVLAAKMLENDHNILHSQPTWKIFIDLKSTFDPITNSKKRFENISKRIWT